MRRLIPAVVVIAAIAIAIGGTLMWAQSMRRALRDQDVVHANALAAKDVETVRLVTVRDSQVAVTRRLAYQGAVELRAARAAYADLQDTVDVMGVSLAQLKIRGDSLEVVIAGHDAEVDTLGTITAEGELDARDSLGVSVRASVEIPPTLESPIWRWSVAREPLSLSLGLQCEGTLAAAYVTGPAWASLVLDSVVQRDEICNPIPSSWRPFEIKVPSIPVIIVTLLAGMFAESRLRIFSEEMPL